METIFSILKRFSNAYLEILDKLVEIFILDNHSIPHFDIFHQKLQLSIK